MTDNAPRPAGSKRPASNMDAALDLARRGFHVFPIEAGKKAPALCKWSREATTNEATIRRWWRLHPDANIGIATGPSGLLVVDVDNKKGKDGSGSLKFLQALHEPLPSTLTSRTASGGRHIFLRGSGETSQGRLGPGLDVRSVGGYVVAPGSRIDGGGEYGWEHEAPVAEAPAWLIGASERKRAEYPPQGNAGTVSPYYLSLILEGLDPGDFREYEDWLKLMMACHYATAGLGADEFVEWSTQDPPYADHAHKIRYHWDSLSVAPAGRRPITERSLFDTVLKQVGHVLSSDPLKDFDPIEVDAEIEVEAEAEDRPHRSRFRVFRPSELLSLPKPRWLVEDMLVEGELAVVYGPPKAGKTFLALDLALSVATGTEFHGGRAVEAPGPVLYVIGEGNDALFGERIQAWCDARGLRPPDDTFFAVADRPDIGDPQHVSELVAITKPRLIILDTLSRTMTGDENSPDAMAAYVRGCDDLRRKTGAAVVVVHHEGKDSSRGPMGHTKLRGALDTSIRVHQKNGDIWVEMADQRNGPSDLALSFRLDGRVLTLIARTAHDETPDEDFLSGDDLRARVRQVAAGLAGSSKTKVVEALMSEFKWNRMKARRQLDAAVPRARSADRAVDFEGGRLWFEAEDDRPSSPATLRFDRPVSGP